MVKSENKHIEKIGILGGTFDPPHKGHLKISQIAKKKFNLKNIFWAITKKNPFKRKSYFSLNKRIKLSRSLTKKQDYIISELRKYITMRLLSNNPDYDLSLIHI